MPETKYCSECGKPIPTDATYCTECGKRQTEEVAAHRTPESLKEIEVPRTAEGRKMGIFDKLSRKSKNRSQRTAYLIVFWTTPPPKLPTPKLDPQQLLFDRLRRDSLRGVHSIGYDPLTFTKPRPPSKLELQQIKDHIGQQSKLPVRLLKVIQCAEREMPDSPDTFVISCCLLACEEANIAFDSQRDTIAFQSAGQGLGVATITVTPK
jgi:hypothetical protein